MSSLGQDPPLSRLLPAPKKPPRRIAKAPELIGQMIVGRAAENAFLALFHEAFSSEDITLRDVAPERSDTDLHLFDSRERPLARINIKFVGSVFRRAVEIVGLDPEDCFALATYKIRSSRQREIDDKLPFLFAVVSVPHLTRGTVGGMVESDILMASQAVLEASLSGKRTYEDRVVDVLVKRGSPAYAQAYQAIHDATWRLISATKAEMVLRRLMFERVPALSVPSFTSSFRNAEVDMHFSLSTDLTSLQDMLNMLKKEGPQAITTRTARGEL